jgi:hypothetical protein
MTLTGETKSGNFMLKQSFKTKNDGGFSPLYCRNHTSE